jgi:hypothetical protein
MGFPGRVNGLPARKSLPGRCRYSVFGHGRQHSSANTKDSRSEQVNQSRLD